MNNLTIISAGLAWGGLLSLFHFGGLWLSLVYLPRTTRPKLWFYGGLLMRYTITLTGMWFAQKHGALTIIATCTGFYVMRMFLIPKLTGINTHLRR